MHITGIIAEYNPFHNGHAYQLKQLRADTDTEYIVIAMSGNYVQRGAPALLDKFTRTKMALAAGADLVLELPALWSSASAEYYAGAGVALLDQLGCVNTLCFGCEATDISLMDKISRILMAEPASYRTLLELQLKDGKNYAAARQNALCAQLAPAERPAAESILYDPNNILALEYFKAIRKAHAKLTPYPIKREGAAYHSTLLDPPFASASAIRSYLAGLTGQKSDDPIAIKAPEGSIMASETDALAIPGPAADTGSLAHPTDALTVLGLSADADRILSGLMPSYSFELLKEYYKSYTLLFENDFSSMLHYALLQHGSDGYSDFADCTPDFSNKIRKHLDSFVSFTDFCHRLKSKELTYTRISRSLLHILLDIRKADYEWQSHGYMPYAHVLGFQKNAAPLLKLIKKNAAIPLLTSASDYKKILSADAQHFYEKHLYTDRIYRGIVQEKCGHGIPDDFRIKLEPY